MNKSILVIDTPENCYYCELNNYHFCNVTGNNIKEYLATEYRPKWCPLSPLPHRQCMTIYGIGYNQCLDDILKGETK